MADYNIDATTYDTTLTRDRYFSAPIRWSAIIAATVISVAIYWTLAALGTAVGLGAFDPAEGDTVGRGALLTAGIYHLVAAVVSLYIAGYVAGKASGVVERMGLGLHGLCTWALTMVFVASMIASGVGTAFSAIAHAAAPAATVGLSKADTQALISGDSARAQTVIDNLRNQTTVSSTMAAEKSADVGAASSWFAFLTLLLGAAAAMFGAMSVPMMAYKTTEAPTKRTSYRTSGATAGL